MSTTFQFNGRIDVAVTLLGKSFTLIGEVSLRDSGAAVLRMSLERPVFDDAVDIGTLKEVVDALNDLPRPGGGPALNLTDLVNQVKTLPGLGDIAKNAATNLETARIKITELMLEISAPSDGVTLPPGKLTVGMGLDLRQVAVSDRKLLGAIVLDSIILTVTVVVGS